MRELGQLGVPGTDAALAVTPAAAAAQRSRIWWRCLGLEGAGVEGAAVRAAHGEDLGGSWACDVSTDAAREGRRR